MKPIHLAGLAASIVVIGAGGWYIADQRIRSAFDARLDQLVQGGQYEALYYDSLDYSFDGSITIDGLHVQQQGVHFRFDSVSLSKLEFGQTFPHNLDVKVRGLGFPDGLALGDDAQLALLLGPFADDEQIPLELDYQHRYQPEQDFQLDSTLAVKLPGLMNVDFSSRLRQLPIEALQALPADSEDPALVQQQLQLLANAELPSARMSLQDLGLVQALVEGGAGRFGATPDDYRNMLVNQARNAYLFLPQGAQTLAMDAGAQLATFLEGGRTLTLALAPEHDGHIGRLQTDIMGAMFTGNFSRVAEVLNLELRTD